MFLEVENISKSFNKHKVVDNLSFKLNKGELLCLLGPSGCGKTTLLNILGGFVKQDSGIINLNGEDISNKEPNVRPFSTVFQSYGLFPHMSVIENITYGLRFRKLSKKQIKEKGEEYLELVGLKDHRDSRISELSGGQQQRTAIARSLIINPAVCLLDEPFCNLDAELRVKMREELKTLQFKLGLTIIFVTHDQEEALFLSDCVSVMLDGKLKGEYSINDVKNKNIDGESFNFLHLEDFAFRDDYILKSIKIK